MMNSSSTIVTSDLYEDVEQLKTNVTTLTSSHLSTATEHDAPRYSEIYNSRNKVKISDLQRDFSSNTTRIGDLESDVSQ